jgi:hypothetical protein
VTTTHITNKAKILAHLAEACHAHTEGLLIKDVPIPGRFDSGDRQIIIELYGEKIIDLSKKRILRFRDVDGGIDEHTTMYFIRKSVKALDRIIEQAPFASYNPLRIATMIMQEFEAIPKYRTYELVL